MSTTTVPARSAIRCDRKGKCQYLVAQDLHRAYLKALKKLSGKLMKQRQEEVRVASFVRDVTEGAAKKDAEVWEHLLVAGKSGSASSFANSYLKQYIEEKQATITAIEEQVEDAANALVKHLRSKKFNNDLIKGHMHSQIEDLGPYDDPKIYTDTLYHLWRHIDHCVAAVTDQLAESQAGREFLEEVLVTSGSGGAAFKDVWGWASKAKSVAGPLAKFTYNVGAIVVFKIRQASQGKSLTIKALLADADVSEVVSKLGSKFNLSAEDLNKWIGDRAKNFSSRVDAKNITDLKKVVDKFDDLAEKEFDAAAAAKNKLDAAWFTLTLNVIAFAVATTEMVQKLKKSKTKDWISFAGSLASFAGDIADIKAAHELAKSKGVVNSSTATTMAKTLGIAAQVAGVVVSAMELDSALKSRKADKLLFAWTGTLLATSGLVATIVGASVASGVLAVVGVAIAVVAAIMLTSSPIGDFVEKTQWGMPEPADIHLTKVIEEYFKTFFKVEVSVKEWPGNEFDRYILIRCEGLTDAGPVQLTVTREDTGKSESATVIPGRASIKKKGRVEKVDGTWKKTENWFGVSERAIRVHEPWEALTNIALDDDTEHTIEAKLDLDGNGNFELVGKDTGVEFPKFVPTLAKPGVGYPEQLFEEDPAHGSGTRFHFPDDGFLHLNAFTKFATGFKVKVRADWDTDDVQETDDGSDGWTKVKAPNKKHQKYDWRKTVVPVRVSHPEDSGGYDAELTWTLVAPDGSEIDSASFDIVVKP